MIDSICVIGHNSKYGGADTELDHQMDVWAKKLGVTVHMMPTGTITPELASMNNIERGVIYHQIGDYESLRGMHVISYCNRHFLDELPKIRKYAKTVTWVNCMCWCFDAEKNAVKEGLIDYHLFQSHHQMESIREGLLNDTGVALDSQKAIVIRPTFNIDAFNFNPTNKGDPSDVFRFCKIQRADVAKFMPETLRIFQAIAAPNAKEAHIMAWDDAIAKKCKAFSFGGNSLSWIKTYPAGKVPVRELYDKCHAMIIPSTLKENLPRVGQEAMASGCVLVAPDHSGWRELIKHGETGFLCIKPQDYVYYASRVAYENEERIAMAKAARESLIKKYGDTSSEWREFFLRLASA
jgi:hypothetical protein